MVLVVESQRPETPRWRLLARRKGDGVGTVAVQLLAVAVEVLIKVLRLARCVDEDVGLRDSRPGEVVRAELGAVILSGPVMRQRNPVVMNWKRGVMRFLSASTADATSAAFSFASFAAASRTLCIMAYRASSPGSGGTSFNTVGRTSKKLSGTTHLVSSSPCDCDG
jgi:hypothetical protein